MLSLTSPRINSSNKQIEAFRKECDLEIRFQIEEVLDGSFGLKFHRQLVDLRGENEVVFG
jgi:hypothetical protein